MMMRRAITLTATVLIIAASIIGGWLIGENDTEARTIGAVSGFLISAVICSIVCGFFFVLLDIKEHVRVTAEDTTHIAISLNKITSRMDTEFLASIRIRKRRSSPSQRGTDKNVVALKPNWVEAVLARARLDNNKELSGARSDRDAPLVPESFPSAEDQQPEK